MRAVTFDFYNTLVHHHLGKGRGQRFTDYLAAAGLSSDPWEHQVLYDVFEYYDEAYRPTLSSTAKSRFWTDFTRRLFERTNVHANHAIDYAEHGPAIRDIMGPNSLAVFEEVPSVLSSLKDAGIRLAIISDWQKGLRYFCEELGVASFFETVVASADVGCQKPDPRLFDAARERLQVSARDVLHVGDSADDVKGARAAGFAAVLLARDGSQSSPAVPVVTTLREIFPLV